MCDTLIYVIANWKQRHETNQTLKMESLPWVLTPNRHDDLVYRRMLLEPDAPSLYCAWNLILQVASHGRPSERGKLVRGGKPLSAEDLATITGFPAGIFEEALFFFSSNPIGWLKREPFSEEQEEEEQPSLDIEAPVHRQRNGQAEIIYSYYPRKVAKPNALKAITKALKGMSFEVLLSKTCHYAETVAGVDLEFIPHPATWFNQQRYNDHPATWRRSGNAWAQTNNLSPVAKKISLQKIIEDHPCHPGSKRNNGRQTDADWADYKAKIQQMRELEESIATA